MEINKNDILANLIMENFNLLKVIDRFDISLGIANQTIQEVSELQDIDADLLCLTLNVFHSLDFKIPNTQNYKLIPPLLHFLEQSHFYFLNERIPSIKQNISKLLKNITEPNASLIKDFFDNYIKEVHEHMKHENSIVFVYIKDLYQKYLIKNGEKHNPDFSIFDYEKAHDDIEQVLLDIKNLLLKHLPQKDDKTSRVKVLVDLFELEQEFHHHQRLEDQLLIPLVKSLENKLGLKQIKVNV